MILRAFLLCSLVGLSKGIIGYDCGAPTSEITTVSLLEVGKCDMPEEKVKTSQNFVQLIQLIDYHETKVIQCKVKIDRQVTYCGWNSYASVVSGGRMQYIHEISRESCLDMHKRREIIFGNTLVTGLAINGTTTRDMTFAGQTDSSGNCITASYSDPYGTWHDVVVTGFIEISLFRFNADVKLDADGVFLRSKTTCKFSDLSCMDPVKGNSFWDRLPTGDCNFDKYGVLFNGVVNKTESENDIRDRVVYSLESNQVTFALRAKGCENVCGYKIIRTEHPKLFLLETSPTSLIVNRGVSTINLDPFAYVNSKFVYLERHFQMHIKSLYREMFMQRCDVERTALQNSLILATLAPDEFAYQLMKGPGYMAVVAGEVVHVIRCLPTEVRVEHVDDCFHHLAVTRGNESYFMTPKTHILINKGSQRSCDTMLSPYYFLGNNWYKLDPSLTQALPPNQIKPMTNITWNYTEPEGLATNGIYCEEKLKNLKDHVLFQMNEKGVVNKFVRGAMGEDVIDQGESLVKLLDKKSLKKIAESAWEETWGRFITFGTASAGVIGVIMIIRVIKLAIDTVIHGYALHVAYGWSFAMLGAFWDSLTGLLLWLAGRKAQGGGQGSPSNSDDVELGLRSIEPKEMPEQLGPTAIVSAVVHEDELLPIVETADRSAQTVQSLPPVIAPVHNGLYPRIPSPIRGLH